VEVITGGNTYYFQQDGLGNVTALTNSAGVIVEQYAYDAFGKPTIKDGTGTVKSTPMTPFLFTGREYDSETGLYNYRTRAYSPTLGRFLQADTINFKGGSVNLYRYVSNNPIRYTDPKGRVQPGLMGQCAKAAAQFMIQYNMWMSDLTQESVSDAMEDIPEQIEETTEELGETALEVSNAIAEDPGEAETVAVVALIILL
jgi:RHS repeat-associated protein